MRRCIYNENNVFLFIYMTKCTIFSDTKMPLIMINTFYLQLCIFNIKIVFLKYQYQFEYQNDLLHVHTCLVNT